MKKIYILLFIIAAGFSSGVFACDCDPMLSVKESIADADLVIHGKILKATLNKNFSRNGKGNENTFINEYEVLVIKKYKSTIKTDTLIIRTNTNEANCGLTFEENSEVFFYAYKTRKESEFYSASRLPLFWTSSCSRTDEYTRKEQDEIEDHNKPY